VQIFASVDEEAADVFETPDAAGKNLLMSRRHAWRDGAMRRAAASVAVLHSLQSELEKRMREDKELAANGRKKPRLFDEYQCEQWALEQIEKRAAERKAEEDSISAQIRAVQAQKAALEQEMKYQHVSALWKCPLVQSFTWRTMCALALTHQGNTHSSGYHHCR
jgi:hypothetical protein